MAVLYSKFIEVHLERAEQGFFGDDILSKEAAAIAQAGTARSRATATRRSDGGLRTGANSVYRG